MTEREKWDRISTRASNLWPVRHLPRFFHRIEILPMRCSSSLPRVRAYSPSGRIAHLNSHATYSHYAWNPNVANNPANMKSCFLTKFKIAPFPSRPPVSPVSPGTPDQYNHERTTDYFREAPRSSSSTTPIEQCNFRSLRSIFGKKCAEFYRRIHDA